jgi:nucleoside-diphosphate-sugar epimerase
MTRVLVSGCAGYIGIPLVEELLREGFRVHGVDNLLYDQAEAILPLLGHPRFRFTRGDVAEDEVIQKVSADADVIIPLAGLVGAPLCEREKLWATRVNYRAVERLVQLAPAHAQFLFPNTNSGYGSTDGKRACTEKDPLEPISHYGRTKCAAEAEVLKRQGSVVFRLATVFGYAPRMRMDLLANDFTQRLVRIKQHGFGQLTLFEPHFLRNFVHVRDVARAFVWALKNPATVAGVYNLGNPDCNQSKMRLAQIICDRLGLSRDTLTIGEGRDPDQRNYLVSNDKVLAAGFRFGRSLVAGIDEVSRLCELLPASKTHGMKNA